MDVLIYLFRSSESDLWSSFAKSGDHKINLQDSIIITYVNIQDMNYSIGQATWNEFINKKWLKNDELGEKFFEIFTDDDEIEKGLKEQYPPKYLEIKERVRYSFLRELIVIQDLKFKKLISAEREKEIIELTNKYLQKNKLDTEIDENTAKLYRKYCYASEVFLDQYAIESNEIYLIWYITNIIIENKFEYKVNSLSIRSDVFLPGVLKGLFRVSDYYGLENVMRNTVEQLSHRIRLWSKFYKNKYAQHEEEAIFLKVMFLELTIHLLDGWLKSDLTFDNYITGEFEDTRNVKDYFKSDIIDVIDDYFECAYDIDKYLEEISDTLISALNLRDFNTYYWDKAPIKNSTVIIALPIEHNKIKEKFLLQCILYEDRDLIRFKSNIILENNVAKTIQSMKRNVKKGLIKTNDECFSEIKKQVDLLDDIIRTSEKSNFEYISQNDDGSLGKILGLIKEVVENQKKFIYEEHRARQLNAIKRLYGTLLKNIIDDLMNKIIGNSYYKELCGEKKEIPYDKIVNLYISGMIHREDIEKIHFKRQLNDILKSYYEKHLLKHGNKPYDDFEDEVIEKVKKLIRKESEKVEECKQFFDIYKVVSEETKKIVCYDVIVLLKYESLSKEIIISEKNNKKPKSHWRFQLVDDLNLEFLEWVEYKDKNRKVDRIHESVVAVIDEIVKEKNKPKDIRALISFFNDDNNKCVEWKKLRNILLKIHSIVKGNRKEECNKIILRELDKTMEKIEIENIGNEPVNTMGWTLVSDNGNKMIEITDKCVLEVKKENKKKFFTLKKTKDSTIAESVWNNNSNDKVILLNTNGIVVAKIMDYTDVIKITKDSEDIVIENTSDFDENVGAWTLKSEGKDRNETEILHEFEDGYILKANSKVKLRGNINRELAGVDVLTSKSNQKNSIILYDRYQRETVRSEE